MIAGIQQSLSTCWQQTERYLDESGLMTVIVKIQSFVRTIFEALLTATLFCLSPFIFPLALFVGMTQIVQVELALEQVTLIWNYCWPLICLAAIPLIYLACIKKAHYAITATLAIASSVCALHWGSRIATWIKERKAHTATAPAYATA